MRFWIKIELDDGTKKDLVVEGTYHAMLPGGREAGGMQIEPDEPEHVEVHEITKISDLLAYAPSPAEMEQIEAQCLRQCKED